jgi:hypothetical protein
MDEPPVSNGVQLGSEQRKVSQLVLHPARTNLIMEESDWKERDNCEALLE